VSIAVITPAYNAEHTLDAALASVAAQSLLPDEVIVADDGSTDATASVARAWSSRLPVRVVSTAGRLGPAAARSAAIEASTSSLLALLDADDAFLTDHLALMLAVYERTDDGLASANTLRWIPGRVVSDVPLNAIAPIPPRDQQLAWLLGGNHLSIASLFSRARYDAVGGFRAEFHGTEDWDLWIRMVRAGAEVVRPDAATLLYRLSAGNVSSEDRLVQAKLQVLDAAEREGASSDHDVIAASRRRLHAAASLQDAYRLAQNGRSLAARAAALRALPGIRPVAVRGIAMAVAPKAVARRREKVRYNPSVWLKRYSSSG
jgi:glycosyltransferase involved in cell wall biosynthesis